MVGAIPCGRPGGVPAPRGTFFHQEPPFPVWAGRLRRPRPASQLKHLLW